jgi:hypothetical protein
MVDSPPESPPPDIAAVVRDRGAADLPSLLAAALTLVFTAVIAFGAIGAERAAPEYRSASLAGAAAGAD